MHDDSNDHQQHADPPHMCRCRATPADPPPAYMASGLRPADNFSDKWCAPYGYKEREQGCGGADKWPVFPSEAFPGQSWAAGGCCAARLTHCSAPMAGWPWNHSPAGVLLGALQAQLTVGAAAASFPSAAWQQHTHTCWSPGQHSGRRQQHHCMLAQHDCSPAAMAVQP